MDRVNRENRRVSYYFDDVSGLGSPVATLHAAAVLGGGQQPGGPKPSRMRGAAPALVPAGSIAWLPCTLHAWVTWKQQATLSWARGGRDCGGTARQANGKLQCEQPGSGAGPDSGGVLDRRSFLPTGLLVLDGSLSSQHPRAPLVTTLPAPLAPLFWPAGGGQLQLCECRVGLCAPGA